MKHPAELYPEMARRFAGVLRTNTRALESMEEFCAEEPIQALVIYAAGALPTGIVILILTELLAGAISNTALICVSLALLAPGPMVIVLLRLRQRRQRRQLAQLDPQLLSDIYTAGLKLAQSHEPQQGMGELSLLDRFHEGAYLVFSDSGEHRIRGLRYLMGRSTAHSLAGDIALLEQLEQGARRESDLAQLHAQAKERAQSAAANVPAPEPGQKTTTSSARDPHVA